jgi:hypothetical protein
MDDALTLFFSLPVAAQASIKATVNHKDPTNPLKLTRLIYPYVQTLADARGIAALLANERDLDYEPGPSADFKLIDIVTAPTIADKSSPRNLEGALSGDRIERALTQFSNWIKRRKAIRALLAARECSADTES